MKNYNKKDTLIKSLKKTTFKNVISSILNGSDRFIQPPLEKNRL